MISILVSENEYYYENDVIEIEDFIKIVKEAGENAIVKISEKKATYKAYSKLVNKLKEMEISLVETE